MQMFGNLVVFVIGLAALGSFAGFFNLMANNHRRSDNEEKGRQNDEDSFQKAAMQQLAWMFISAGVAVGCFVWFGYLIHEPPVIELPATAIIRLETDAIIQQAPFTGEDAAESGGDSAGETSADK